MPPLAGIVVAALGGAAIGVERQRSGHATGVGARFGGVRTFTLLGGAAGLAGWLSSAGFDALAVVLTAGCVALVIAGYVAASGRDVDATTEAAGLVVIAAGVLAGLGSLALASATIAVTTLLLVEKSTLHALVGRIDDEGLRAGVRFAVMAVVILPLLPEGPYGPLGGVRPRELWLLVLFFSGLSFAGYLARRAVGSHHGYPMAGLLGGIVSSTSVTFTFARLSRTERAVAGPLALGTIGACTMLFPRVLLATAVLNVGVARALLPYLVPPFIVGAAALVIGIRRNDGEVGGTSLDNPLQVGPALQMAATFQVVLFAVAAVREWFGAAGLLVSGAVLGLTDVDALTISMSKAASAGVAAGIAAEAIAIGILANSAMKLALATALGAPGYRRLGVPVLIAMLAAAAIAIKMMR
ncbi:MAG: MgtC/SapB family protein [Betaproteobacteria bacterium]